LTLFIFTRQEPAEAEHEAVSADIILLLFLHD